VKDAEPLLAWPGMASLRFSLPLAYLFSKIFFSVYGGASLLASLRDPRLDFHFSWELDLPFFPSLSIVYLSVPLLLLLTPFILRTWRSFTPFFITLTVETLVAGVFFLVLPTTQAYPERVASGFFAGVFRLADRMNLEYNEFPSLHIAFAITAAIVFGRRCGWFGRTLFFLWAAGVAASTLFLHEHHLLDLVGGAVLGLAAVATVQNRASEERVLEVLRTEGLCFKEFAHFARRHPRYLLVAAALVRASLGRWRQTRLLRAAYCLAQHVDDVLDGDRKVKADPEAYVQAVLGVLRGLAPAPDSTVEQLAAFVAAQAGDEERRELIDLFRVLLEDRRRMDARRPWGAAELAEHHRRTFFYSFDLTFRFAGAGLRAVDVPELIDALSWVSPIRDLEKDFQKGLLNVPREVLETAGGRLDSPAVREWLRSEHLRGAAAIEALGARLGSVKDPRGRKILAAFHKALAAYERKYRRKNPDPTKSVLSHAVGADRG
jgi:membrane-associated phospholipid phosphatase